VATPSKKIPGDKPGIVRGQFAYIAKNKGNGRRELIFSAMLMEWQYQAKKNPGDKPGVNQGEKLDTPEKKPLMQPRPTNQLNRTPSQIKILCQHCFNIGHIRVVIHRSTEFNDTAEFISAAIVCVG